MLQQNVYRPFNRENHNKSKRIRSKLVGNFSGRCIMKSSHHTHSPVFHTSIYNIWQSRINVPVSMLIKLKVDCNGPSYIRKKMGMSFMTQLCSTTTDNLLTVIHRHSQIHLN